MTKIHINRHTITRGIMFYIISWFSVLFYIISMKNYLGENFQTAALYMIFTIFYLPLNVFAMFLSDTSPSITIPGLVSMVICGYVLLGKIDITVNV